MQKLINKYIKTIPAFFVTHFEYINVRTCIIDGSITTGMALNQPP